jgi:hypothetical protein
MAIVFNARTNTIELSSGTMTFEASDTSDASLNIPHGVAPTTPADGDVWTTTAGIFVEVNGGTVGPLSDGAGAGTVTSSGSPLNNEVAVFTSGTDIDSDSTFTWDGSTLAVGGTIRATDAAGPTLVNEAASGTNPTLIPNRGDLTTGIGSIGAGGVSIVTSGVERVSTGTVTHSINLNTTITTGGAGPLLQIGDGDMTDQDVMLRLNSDAPYGFIQEGEAGTARMALKAFTNDDFTIQDSSGNEVFFFDVANGIFSAYGGNATDNHYLGIDANNRIRFESGSNYTVFHHEDDNVSTESRNMYFNIQSAATGTPTFWWRLNGSDVVQWDVDDGRFVFAGAIEFTESSDHATLSSGRTQIWAKSNTLDPELMVSTGDSGNDHTLMNVVELSYHFSQTTTAADPGAGILRWNNATPASVTNWYVDDVESTGRDSSYMLANLADGDIVTMRNQRDAADYMVASVNGTPTDNVGYWTIPVTVIHAGTRPNTNDPMHISVEWAGSQGGSVAAGDITAGNLISTVLPYSTVSATASAFKVPFINTTAGVSGNFGMLFDNDGFTYNPSTNTMTAGSISAGTITSTVNFVDAGLTDNDVLIAGTGGVIEDSAGNLTFNGTTLAVTGALTVDNITIDAAFVQGSADIAINVAGGETALYGAANGSTTLMYNDIDRWETLATGHAMLKRDVSNDSSNSYLVWAHADDTHRARAGYFGLETFTIKNMVHGGPFTMSVETSGGTEQTIFTASPDGDAGLFYAGLETIRSELYSAADQVSGGEVKDAEGNFKPVGIGVLINDSTTFDTAATHTPFQQINVNEVIYWVGTGASNFDTYASTGTSQTDIPAGATWIVQCNGSGTLVIRGGSLVTIRFWDASGAPADADVTVARGGVATVRKVSDTIYDVWGSGLS